MSHRQLCVSVRDRRTANAQSGPFNFAESAAHALFGAKVGFGRLLSSSHILKQITEVDAVALLLLARQTTLVAAKTSASTCAAHAFICLEFADAASAMARTTKQSKFAPSDWIVCFGTGGRLPRPGVNAH